MRHWTDRRRSRWIRRAMMGEDFAEVGDSLRGLVNTGMIEDLLSAEEAKRLVGICTSLHRIGEKLAGRKLPFSPKVM